MCTAHRFHVDGEALSHYNECPPLLQNSSSLPGEMLQSALEEAIFPEASSFEVQLWVLSTPFTPTTISAVFGIIQGTSEIGRETSAYDCCRSRQTPMPTSPFAWLDACLLFLLTKSFVCQRPKQGTRILLTLEPQHVRKATTSKDGPFRKMEELASWGRNPSKTFPSCLAQLSQLKNISLM